MFSTTSKPVDHLPPVSEKLVDLRVGNKGEVVEGTWHATDLDEGLQEHTVPKWTFRHLSNAQNKNVCASLQNRARLLSDAPQKKQLCRWRLNSHTQRAGSRSGDDIWMNWEPTDRGRWSAMVETILSPLPPTEDTPGRKARSFT